MLGELRTITSGPNKGYTGPVTREYEDYASHRTNKMITWVDIGSGLSLKRVLKSKTKKADKSSIINSIDQEIRVKVMEIRSLLIRKKEALKPSMAEKEINALLAKVTMDDDV